MESDSATIGLPASAPAPDVFAESPRAALTPESQQTHVASRREIPGFAARGLDSWGGIPLFHAAWLFALGIAAAKFLWLRPSVVLVALALTAALCTTAALRAQRIAWLPLGILWCLLGAWCAEMEPHPASASVLSALSDGLLRTVEGTIVDAGPVAPRPVQHQRDALLVEAIDVGQGDSLLLITPDGKTLLVDGGGFGGGPRPAAHYSDEEQPAGTSGPQEFDIGEEVVSPALWARGIRRLDVVALSHAHSDHMGGLPAVLRNFQPAELWVGNNPRTESYDALLREAADLHVRLRSLRAGDGLHLGNTDVAVLAPLPNYQPGLTPTNNDSLVLRVAYGQASVLLEGDAEAPVEEAMLAEPGLPSTLLKVGHHGSVSSTRPEFLARVVPQWAVISCGLHNRYGHPRPEVLAELQRARVRTFSTDIQGATCFRLDGKTTSAEVSCASDR